MRSQLFVLSVGFAIGCGGGGGTKLPDAKIFMDAGIDAAPLCSVMNSLGGLGIGSAAAPAAGDFIDNPTMGPLMGRTILSIGGRLPSSTATMIDLLIVDYVKPMAANFTVGAPVNFDPNAMNQVYVAASYVFGDVDMAGMNFANFYYASTGSITLTAVGEAAGSNIAGSVQATNYREVNPMDGADIAGGCTTALMGLSFNLTHTNAFAPGTAAGEGLQPLTEEEWNVVRTLRGRVNVPQQ